MENLISVIVATYKKTDGLISTLESIRLQNYKRKELIVTDDGSGNEIIGIIEAYIEKYKNDFYAVRFIKHETNVGTVKNVQNAYKLCNGEIIKGISPGDLLYDPTTLEKINAFFNERNPVIACGFPRTYCIKENVVVDTNNFNYETYANLNDRKKTYFNVLYANNFITGASLILNKDALIRYNLMLPETIKYAEDLIQSLAVLKEIEISLMKDFIIWYEDGTGISTRENTLFSQKLRLDHQEFYRWLLVERKLPTKALRDVSVKYVTTIEKTIFSRIFCMFKNPSYLKFIIDMKIRKKYKSNTIGNQAWLYNNNQSPFRSLITNQVVF